LKTFEVLLTNLMEESETWPITETQLKTLNYLVNNKGNYLEKLLNFLQWFYLFGLSFSKLMY
jgi:hypothetical protein